MGPGVLHRAARHHPHASSDKAAAHHATAIEDVAATDDAAAVTAAIGAACGRAVVGGRRVGQCLHRDLRPSAFFFSQYLGVCRRRTAEDPR